MNPILILLAAHNGEAYLVKQIDSILRQTDKDWRLILSDDRSSDATRSILLDYAEQYPDRIVFFDHKQQFGSPVSHFLFLLSHFAEEDACVMFADQDDVWHADKVEVCRRAMAETMRSYDGPLLLHTDLRVVDSELREIAPSFLRRAHLSGQSAVFSHLLIQNVVSGNTCMMNPALLRLCAKHLPREMPIMHDWWLALIAAAYGRIVFLDQATVDYRQHDGNQVGSKDVGSFAFFTGKLLHPVKARFILRETMRQARLFGECFDNRLACGYGALPNISKLRRIRFVAQNNIWKVTPNKCLGILGEILLI